MISLTEHQRELLTSWLPGYEPVADMSWGNTNYGVYRVHQEGREYVVKAGGPHDHHLVREITAHETVLPQLPADCVVPSCVATDREARILVTEYLPGTLVDMGEGERDPELLYSAGKFLRALHSIESFEDPTIHANLVEAAVKWLDKPHNIPPDEAREARWYLKNYPASPAHVVSSHGDFSGRNWLQTSRGLAVIDFGRFGHRPASHDLLRMFFRRWYDHPQESGPFFGGYGDSPSVLDGEDWWMNVLREAVATAAWAHKVGDGPFEELGLRFVSVALNSLK